MTDDSEQDSINAEDLREAWLLLDPSDRLTDFRLLPSNESEDFFLGMPARDQVDLLLSIPRDQRRPLVRLLPPDDVADLIQALPVTERDAFLRLLDETHRREVSVLLAYAEDEAGGLMSTRFARLRADMPVDEAVAYLRRQAPERPETLDYLYVLDDQQKLLGVLSLRELFLAPAASKVRDVMRTDLVTLAEGTDQEAVTRLFAEHDLYAVPVVDAEGHMKGLVTVDDVVDVVEEEATEDIQKLGGMEALEEPYLRVSFRTMLQKRGGWLAALFIGEMFTATAMTYFEDEIAKAVVLALFVPLIISSGGNSGSQATTLVIRAMALGEVRLQDWWRVVGREIGMGLALGVILATIGFFRIVIWQWVSPTYGPDYVLVAATVFVSLIGVVLTGTVAGSLLPFMLRRVGLDPASASAPFVATIVDVAGLVIYFSVASVFLARVLAS